MKKTLLLLLALSLLLTTMLFASCKKDPPSVTDEETKNTEADTSDDELTTEDILGFGTQNYQEEFKILLNNTGLNERDFYVEAESSDIVSVATYDRNLACEEYLGISIEFIREAGHWNSGMADRIYDLVFNGSCEYDMVAMGMNTGIIGGHTDIYQNILQMQYIDLSHSWWVQDMIDQISINNKLFFLTGDTCVTTYAYIGCVFANLEVAESYNIDVDFYDLVHNGNWTLEEFCRLFRLVGTDSNNDGKYDAATETYGWANNGVGVRLMWSSCDMNLIERQEDGTFALRESLDDIILAFIDTVRLAFEDPRSSYSAQSDEMVKAFSQDRVLLATSMLSSAELFKTENMESPFAILPLPKYNTEQKDYISTNMCAYNALFFPKTLDNPEMSAQVAEFMGWYGQQEIIPAYYDQALKYRQNDVEANIEMLDLIRDKLRVTPNEIYGVIGETGTDTVMYLTQTHGQNMGPKGFYTIPASVWKTQYPTLSDRISSYVFQYYEK